MDVAPGLRKGLLTPTTSISKSGKSATSWWMLTGAAPKGAAAAGAGRRSKVNGQSRRSSGHLKPHGGSPQSRRRGPTVSSRTVRAPSAPRPQTAPSERSVRVLNYNADEIMERTQHRLDRGREFAISSTPRVRGSAVEIAVMRPGEDEDSDGRGPNARFNKRERTMEEADQGEGRNGAGGDEYDGEARPGSAPGESGRRREARRSRRASSRRRSGRYAWLEEEERARRKRQRPSWAFAAVGRDTGGTDFGDGPPVGHYNPRDVVVRPRSREAPILPEGRHHTRVPGLTHEEMEAMRTTLVDAVEQRAAECEMGWKRSVARARGSTPFVSQSDSRPMLIRTEGADKFYMVEQAAKVTDKRVPAVTSLASTTEIRKMDRAVLTDVFYDHHLAAKAVLPRDMKGHVKFSQRPARPAVTPSLVSDLQYDADDTAIRPRPPSAPQFSTQVGREEPHRDRTGSRTPLDRFYDVNGRSSTGTRHTSTVRMDRTTARNNTGLRKRMRTGEGQGTVDQFYHPNFEAAATTRVSGFDMAKASGRKPLERVANETTPSLAVPSLTEALAVIRRGDDVASEYASRGARVPNVSFKGQSSRDQTPAVRNIYRVEPVVDAVYEARDELTRRSMASYPSFGVQTGRERNPPHFHAGNGPKDVSYRVAYPAKHVPTRSFASMRGRPEPQARVDVSYNVEYGAVSPSIQSHTFAKSEAPRPLRTK